MFLLNQIVNSLEGVDPRRPAFLSQHGEPTSFADFAARVRRLSGWLVDHLPPGGRLGILALNSPEYVEVLLAAAWSGRVAVPLNVRWSNHELAEAIADAGVTLLFVDSAQVRRLAALRAELTVRTISVSMEGDPEALCDYRYDELLKAAPSPMAEVAEDSLAAIIYTGGTTGRAKGAMHTQASLLASAMNFVCAGALPPGGRSLLSLPLFHSGAIGIVFAQLLQRNTTVMAPQFTPERVVSAVGELGVDGLVFVPTMLGMLLDSPAVAEADFERVRALVYGASPMPSGLLQRVLARFPRAAMTQVYGMTEVGLAVMLGDHWHRGEDARISAAGQAGPLYTVRVENEAGEALPSGTPGEVVFYGPGVMRGYFNQPLESDAVRRGGGGLRSGDVGVLDDSGLLTLLDRAKDMIVTGGENVYSVEVENALSRHPAVAQCSVIGVPDAVYGERIHAVIVVRPDQPAPDLEALRAHCARFIAGYKCPRSMELRDSLPLSPMGKILKSTLREAHWAAHQRRVN